MENMVIFKSFSLIVVCFTLFFGSVANAYTPCCCDLKDDMQVQMSYDMPCHETAKDDKNSNSADCEKCNCIHFIQMGNFPIQKYLTKEITANVGVSLTTVVYSYKPDGILQPPKHIS